MITVERIPTRTFIKDVVLIKRGNIENINDAISVICAKYQDVDQSDFVSDIKLTINDHGIDGTSYFATITISTEKCYSMSDGDDVWDNEEEEPHSTKE